MNIEEFGVILTFIVATIGLIVTIVGWSVTARNQKKLLNREILAQREQQSRNLYLPSQIQELEGLKDHIQTTLYNIIEHLQKKEYQKIYESINCWQNEFTKLAIQANQLDIKVRDIGLIQDEKTISLYEIINNVTDLIVKLKAEIDEGKNTIAHSELTSLLDGIVLSRTLIESYIEVIAHGHRLKDLAQK